MAPLEFQCQVLVSWFDLKTLSMWLFMIPRLSYLSILCLTLWPCGFWSGHGESSLKAELHASRKPNSSSLSTHLLLLAPEFTPLEYSFTSANNSSGESPTHLHCVRSFSLHKNLSLYCHGLFISEAW